MGRHKHLLSKRILNLNRFTYTGAHSFWLKNIVRKTFCMSPAVKKKFIALNVNKPHWHDRISMQYIS